MTDERFHEPLDPIRVVIERRGDSALEWSTEDGLVGWTLAPFGVVGEFEGKELKQQMVSWYEVSSLQTYNLSQPPKRNDPLPSVSPCPACEGFGAMAGYPCNKCDGYGYVR